MEFKPEFILSKISKNECIACYNIYTFDDESQAPDTDEIKNKLVEY